MSAERRTPPGAEVAGPPRPRSARGGLPPWAAVALLALYLASQYRDALLVPFINDDFLFLDKTRGASFFSLWAPQGLAFNWYRPWSRELHYWVLQGLFGPRELPFHIASFVLAIGVLAAYFLLIRRIGGTRVAAVSSAGWVALAAWAVPLLWIAGVQDLWMLLFALLALHAVVSEQYWAGAGALALALLSKESAAMLPLVVVALELFVQRRSFLASLGRSLPLWLVTAAWALSHPALGGQLWRPLAKSPPAVTPAPWQETLGRTLAMPLNLDLLPAPEDGWTPATLILGGVGAALLIIMVLWGARAARVRPSHRTPRLVPFGLVWALAGWAPLLMPGLGWHGYYALLGAAGAWVALSPMLARFPVVASVVVAALALARSGRSDTPSLDWGDEWYQRRAASFLSVMRANLLGIVPSPPPHTRFYFVRVPSNVGFMAGNGPALRVWYNDPSLEGGYYPAYRPRAAGEPQGPDLFFRYDSLAGWVQIQPGRQDVPQAQLHNPRWMVDHEMLAQTLARADNWNAALVEYLKLASADSQKVEFAFNVGVCYEALGDSARAAQWFSRAAALPGADDEVRAQVRPSGRRAAGAAGRDSIP